MAETAWRCSQCGTVNEPGSHACAGCGKWPSLFDLQADAGEPETFRPARFEDASAESRPRDVEVFDPDPLESEQLEPRSEPRGEPESEPDDEPEPRRGLKSLTRVIVPVALLLYFLISQLSHR